MSILDLQHRQRELGRIRMGEKGAKGQPVRLDAFRLTSSARHLLVEAAGLWGGEVREWAGAPTPGQFELYTATDTLPIVIPPGREPVTSWYEQWTAGGCTHRCDGGRNYIDDSPCSCDSDDRKCKATTRVNVMLPDLPDIGVWRLETHGINAAMELPGTISVILMASDAGRFLPGRLRIEHRTSKKAGQTRQFVVPVIDLDITSRELMSGSAPARPVTESGAAPAALEAGRAPAAVVEPEATVPASPAPTLISQAQIAKLMATANEKEVTIEELRLIVLDQAGVKSRKLIPKDRFSDVLAAVDALPEPPPDEPEDALFAPERQADQA